MYFPLIDEKYDKQILYLDSSNATVVTSKSNWSVTVNRPISQVKFIEVDSYEVPYAFDFSVITIASSNNNIEFKNAAGSTTYTATIASGTYNGTQLATAVQTAVNAQLAGFTVTTTGTALRFQNATTFNMRTTGDASTTLGLTNSGNTTDYTADAYVTNTISNNYILIASTSVVQPRSVRPYLGSTQANILQKVQIDQASGGVLAHSSIANRVKYNSSIRLTTFDFQLLYSDLNYVNMPSTSNWSITLMLYM